MVRALGGNVYVSFSGGKDSTVLLDIARRLYPDIPAVFSDTGLEYPEIKEFVKTFPNVTIVRPKHSFKEILTKYGYPIISKQVANTVDNASRWIKENLTDDMGGGYKDLELLYQKNTWTPRVCNIRHGGGRQRVA